MRIKGKHNLLAADMHVVINCNQYVNYMKEGKLPISHLILFIGKQYLTVS